MVAGRRHLVAAGAICVVCSAGALWLFERLWQRPAAADLATQPGGWPGAVAVLLLSALVHELLHAVGWTRFARVSWSTLRVRPTARVMGLVADLTVAIPARAYRGGLVLPALTLASLPILAGLAFGSGLSVAWGLLFLIECFTDLVVLLATRGLPAEARVRRHPIHLGFMLDTARLPPG